MQDPNFSDKIELKEEEINIPILLNNLKQKHFETVKQKSLDLVTKIDSMIPEIVIGDSFRLTQILDSLIQNSIHFTPMGGNICIEVSLQDLKASLVEIRFSIIDTGVGIAKDQLDSIQFFFRDKEVTGNILFSRGNSGLSLTKRILKKMEGNISITSEINRGSNFSFIVFLIVPMILKNDLKPMETKTEKKTLNGLRVLLVEDNISNQKVALRYMQKWEIEADLAENGLICLEKISSRDYDLILMDLQMPEMDGYTAAIEIRKKAQPKFQTIPIIALTASALFDTKVKAREAGMNDYISKPFVPQELFEILDRYYKKK